MRRMHLMTLIFGLAACAALGAWMSASVPPSVATGVEHGFVCREPGRFAGWPANNGVWVWGDEILVSYVAGYYNFTADSHSIDRQKPRATVLSRSLDGGKTWKQERPGIFDEAESEGNARVKPADSPGGFDFTGPGFAMRVHHAMFFVSNDRGRTWEGPYRFKGLEKYDMTSRTDYIVNGPRDAFILMSANQPGVKAGDYQDRAFCARTTDGGKTFEFVSWITDQPRTARSVMPSSARVSPTELVSALRRRDDSGGERHNWIDLFASVDNGATWTLRSKVANTDRPGMNKNGNPPSLVRMRDGRVVVTYGYRATPYGMRARVSRDNGKTWGDEIVLRNDAGTWDFGYSRTVQRADGKLVTMYYYNTRQIPEQHIAYTIWSPDAFEAGK